MTPEIQSERIDGEFHYATFVPGDGSYKPPHWEVCRFGDPDEQVRQVLMYDEARQLVDLLDHEARHWIEHGMQLQTDAVNEWAERFGNVGFQTYRHVATGEYRVLGNWGSGTGVALPPLRDTFTEAFKSAATSNPTGEDGS